VVHRWTGISNSSWFGIFLLFVIVREILKVTVLEAIQISPPALYRLPITFKHCAFLFHTLTFYNSNPFANIMVRVPYAMTAIEAIIMA
jgi:hypothetical protein